jgi:hypothetical protein
VGRWVRNLREIFTPLIGPWVDMMSGEKTTRRVEHLIQARHNNPLRVSCIDKMYFILILYFIHVVIYAELNRGKSVWAWKIQFLLRRK